MTKKNNLQLRIYHPKDESILEQILGRPTTTVKHTQNFFLPRYTIISNKRQKQTLFEDYISKETLADKRGYFSLYFDSQKYFSVYHQGNIIGFATGIPGSALARDGEENIDGVIEFMFADTTTVRFVDVKEKVREKLQYSA